MKVDEILIKEEEMLDLLKNVWLAVGTFLLVPIGFGIVLSLIIIFWHFLKHIN